MRGIVQHISLASMILFTEAIAGETVTWAGCRKNWRVKVLTSKCIIAKFRGQVGPKRLGPKHALPQLRPPGKIGPKRMFWKRNSWFGKILRIWISGSFDPRTLAKEKKTNRQLDFTKKVLFHLPSDPEQEKKPNQTSVYVKTSTWSSCSSCCALQGVDCIQQIGVVHAGAVSGIVTLVLWLVVPWLRLWPGLWLVLSASLAVR